MVKVEFLKDFGARKKKDIIDIDSMIASDLIKRKVVKLRQRVKKVE
jgi:hypothetical protein